MWSSVNILGLPNFCISAGDMFFNDSSCFDRVRKEEEEEQRDRNTEERKREKELTPGGLSQE